MTFLLKRRDGREIAKKKRYCPVQNGTYGQPTKTRSDQEIQFAHELIPTTAYDVMCECDDPLIVNTCTTRWLVGSPAFVSEIEGRNYRGYQLVSLLIITGHFMSLTFHTTQHHTENNKRGVKLYDAYWQTLQIFTHTHTADLPNRTSRLVVSLLQWLRRLVAGLYRGGLGSIPGQSMWDLWWTK
jgi:hypothetical protein